MGIFKIFFMIILAVCVSCLQGYGENLINPDGETIGERFGVPEGYQRTEIRDGSFPQHLRRLQLKPHGSPVYQYNGKKKRDHGVYIAVVDMEIGKKNLQQCADAVIRLRAEYLFHQGRKEKIHFNLTNGFKMDFLKWAKGYRLKVSGNRTWWVKTANPSGSYNDFRNYMDVIFMYAGTLSLSKEMKWIPLNQMMIGDVFIQGGSPGHAVIVVDMALCPETGKKIFMIAQSYMPAQDIQILRNPSNSRISPWYDLDFGDELETPEWTFYKTDLKRFP